MRYDQLSSHFVYRGRGRGFGWTWRRRGRVDPHRGRRRRDAWCAVRKSLRVRCMRSTEDGGAMSESAVSEAAVHLRGCQEAEAAVVMARVVPVEEAAAEAEPVFTRAEALGE